MATVLVYLAIMVSLAVICLIVTWLTDRWIAKMIRQMGIFGAFMAFFILSIVVAMLFPTIMAISLTVAGTTLAVAFSLPVLFGLPGWTILPYGAILGLGLYFVITHMSRRKETVAIIPYRN